MKRVIVVGGGISGLALANFLEQEGVSVTVLEAQDHAGGAIRTISQDGFLLELGPNSFLQRPSFSAFLSSLGLEGQIVRPPPEVTQRYLALARKGSAALFQVPKSFGACVRTPILSPLAKLRLIVEPFMPNVSGDDEDVYSFASRRLGKQAAEEIVAPMLAGIWAADIRRLSMRSALPALWIREQKGSSLLSGMLRKKRAGHRPELISLRGGAGTLSSTLCAKLLPGTLRVSTRATRLEKHGETWSVLFTGAGNEEGALTADAVVLTAPAAACGPLVAPHSAQLAGIIEHIPYAPLGIIHVAYKTAAVAHPLSGFGFLTAPTCGHALLGAIFSSSLFPGRAPDGYHLLTCFCGGARNPELAEVSRPELQARVLRELNGLIGGTGPSVLCATYWRNAIPNYPVGHFRIEQAVRASEEEHPGMYFLSNWREGISVTDRIDHARTLALRLSAGLGQARPEVRKSGII